MFSFFHCAVCLARLGPSFSLLPVLLWRLDPFVPFCGLIWFPPLCSFPTLCYTWFSSPVHTCFPPRAYLVTVHALNSFFLMQCFLMLVLFAWICHIFPFLSFFPLCLHCVVFILSSFFTLPGILSYFSVFFSFLSHDHNKVIHMCIFSSCLLPFLQRFSINIWSSSVPWCSRVLFSPLSLSACPYKAF